MQTYLVGGAVRDQLLGYPVHEKDWVIVGATAQQILDAGYTPVGKDFPVFLHPQTKEEHALARTERKTAPGYTGFQFYAAPDVTLEQDLERRDLTINAMAMDENGKLHDPFNGQQDLKDRRLRHVSASFTEDPVRILRVARFAARYHHLGFQVAEETQKLMASMVDNGEVDALVPERVWKEMQRALLETSPDVFFTTLRDCGALAKIMPELDKLFGVPQRADYHPEVDTGIHTMMVLKQACQLSDQLPVRFAALLHDLGKGVTPAETLPSHSGHEERGVPLVKQLCARMAVPKYERELAVLVCRYHLHCHRAEELKASTVVDTLQSLDAFRRPERFEQFLMACEADARGRTGFENRPYSGRPFFQGALRACNTVRVDELVAGGISGQALGDQLRARRISAVKAYKQQKQEQSQQ